MIFRQWEQVLNGAKTQTRRLVRERDYTWIKGHIEHEDGRLDLLYSEVCTIDGQGHLRLRWQVGRTYAVQPGRGQYAMGRIRLLAIRKERLQVISLKDIIAEGIRSVSTDGVLEYLAWQELWDSINKRQGTRWEDDPLVYPLTFEYCDDHRLPPR